MGLAFRRPHPTDDFGEARPLCADDDQVSLALEALEQSVSRERRKLHERIDELRAKIGLPRWREQHDLDDAAY
jgi:hypothetical protein